MDFTLEQIAGIVGGQVAGNGDRRVGGIATLQSAGAGDITFVTNDKYLAAFLESEAGSAIVPEGAKAPGKDVILHANPYAALAALLESVFPEEKPPTGASDLAVVHESVEIGEGASVAPFAVVEHDVVLGAGVRVGAGAFVGHDSQIGANCILYPRAVLYSRTVLGERCIIHSGAVVGADGFGFTREGDGHTKIPQVGGVVVGHDVEIGACSTIDRGTLDPTRIGNHTKIDNLVQIGHNCVIGDRVILCGCVGLAGSAIIEDDVIMAGQTGSAGHLTIGARTQVAAKTAVLSDVAPDSVVAGIPAIQAAVWKRSAAVFRKLPEMKTALRDLQRRIAELEGDS